MSHPEKDSRWEGTSLSQRKDFENLSEKLIHFDEKVPDEIIKSFVLVKKLITYSYFEYEFLDAALERSLICFELALRFKYIDFTGDKIKDAQEKDLGYLIDWANRNGFTEIDKKRIHGLRKLRNSSTHRYSYQLMGSMSFEFISFIVQWINGIYDAEDHRIERKRILRKAKKDLEQYDKWGGILHLPNKKVKITGIELVYYNNKKTPKTYTFVIDQYFDLPIESNEIDNEYDIIDGLSIPPPILIECEDYNFKDSLLHFLPSQKDRSISLEINSKQMGIINMKWKKYINTQNKILKSIIMAERLMYLGRIRFKI